MSCTIRTAEGQDCIVDEEDYNRLQDAKLRMNNGYVFRSGGIVALHRELMGSPKGMEVRFRNGNRLDCRKDNLQVLTVSEHRRLQGALTTEQRRDIFDRSTEYSKTWWKRNGSDDSPERLAAEYGVTVAAIKGIIKRGKQNLF